MGATSVTWDDKEQTITVVVDDFFKSRQYLSYLSGLQSAADDYPLAKRLQHLDLPPYPLHRTDPILIHKSPILLNIKFGEGVMPWSVYDYTFENNTLYIGADWLNMLFLAQINDSLDTLSITYPTPIELDKAITNFQLLTAPRTKEEAIALWIHGQQHRNGALQYSALSPQLKKKALKLLHFQGFVTGGSTPSLEEAAITSTIAIHPHKYRYDVTFKERRGPNDYSTIQQTIIIEEYMINSSNYWLISDVTGDLDYYTILR
ncbi:MAG: hypothetical protein ACRCST_16195 [Turicibacter sp.]